MTTLTDGDVIHAWPNVLPGDRAVLYTSSRVAGAFNDANLVVQPLPTGTPRVIQRGAFHGVYVRSGHIVFVHDGALFALPFDPNRLEPTGPPVRVLTGLASNGLTGGAQFSISDAGTLVYLAGSSLGAGVPVEMIDREGVKTVLRATPANWFTPAFAPDGIRLAMVVRQGPSVTSDIWIHRLGDETITQVTSDRAVDYAPVWSPDGRHITFSSNRDGSTPNLYLATRRRLRSRRATDDQQQ